jgi:ribonuclease HI
MEILRNAHESLIEYQNQQQQLHSNLVNHATQCRSNNIDGWKHPPQNSMKLNVDAHRLASDGRWGVGLILRLDDGRLVGARTKVVEGFDAAIEAEALGLEAAVEMADLFRERKVIIEMDSSMVVKAVQRNRYPRHYWGQIARKGGYYIKANPNMTIQWVRRTRNEAAHQMAKWAGIEPNMTWFDN